MLSWSMTQVWETLVAEKNVWQPSFRRGSAAFCMVVTVMMLGLLAPNPTRDLLLWMNAPDAARSQWSDVLWDVFTKRCQMDFGFDPVADGVLAAAERLAKAEGKWAAVAELYRDSYSSFPNIFGLLAKVQPPQMGLFPDQGLLAGYPQANEQSESALRYALSACASMMAPQACSAVVAAEKEHGLRRAWLWARMGRSPLAEALGHLALVAERSMGDGFAWTTLADPDGNQFCVASD